jgi:hypothetical protein
MNKIFELLYDLVVKQLYARSIAAICKVQLSIARLFLVELLNLTMHISILVLTFSERRSGCETEETISSLFIYLCLVHSFYKFIERS